MAGRFTISEDGLADQITLYHLLLLMASLPFALFYSHLILISLIIHMIIRFKKPVWPLVSVRMLALVSVFLMTVGSTVYAANREAAFTEWGRQMLILLLPLLFCFLRFDLARYRNFLLLVFSFVCTATVLYLYGYAVFTIRYYGLPAPTLFSHAFTNHNFSAPIAIHATFFSMQLALALVFLFGAFLHEARFSYRLLFLVCILILAAGLVQLSSKSVCFCVFLSINLVVPYFLWHKRAYRKYMIITAVLSVMVVAGIAQPGAFRERFIGQLQSDLSQAPAEEFGDPRIARWKIAAELILREPFAGYGAGSEIPLLKNSFFEYRLYKSYLSNLNAHNQYLSFLLKSGFTGLVIYVVTLLFGFRMALARKDMLFFVFVLLVAFVSVSENLLDVNKGIIFYAFFFSFFVFSGNQLVKHPVIE